MLRRCRLGGEGKRGKRCTSEECRTSVTGNLDSKTRFQDGQRVRANACVSLTSAARGEDRQMGRDLERAARYRERADGLRAIAGDLPPGNAQRLVTSIAREYDRLASLLEDGDPADDPASVLAALKRPDNSR